MKLPSSRLIRFYWLLIQLFYVLTVWGENDEILINDDGGSSIQTRPAIAMSEDGYAVICWRDERNGKSEIYAQLIGNKGYKFKKNFLIEPRNHDLMQLYFRVAMANDDHFVVVWSEGTMTIRENVLARLYLANGTPLTPIIQVNDGNDGQTHTAPDVALDQTGNFVVTWSYIVNSGDKAYVLLRRFDRKGNPQGASYRVDESTTNREYYSRLSMTPTGNFAVCWLDYYNDYYNVFYRTFDHVGRAVSSVKRISQHEGQVKPANSPVIFLQDNNDLAIAWSYGKTDDIQAVYARFYQAGAENWSNQIQISPVTWHCKNAEPCIAGGTINGRSVFNVGWASNLEGNADIYTALYLVQGVAWSETPVCINQEKTGNQSMPALGTLKNLNIGICAWVDTRQGNPDIYAWVDGSNGATNVVAGSNFNRIVPLSWDHPYRLQELKKYTIRRSTVRSGPYNTVAEIDLADRGPLGTQIRDWVDHDVVNGTTYYYVIRTNVGGTFMISYSDTVAATPSASMPQIVSPHAVTKPTLDGFVNSVEWRDGLVLRGSHVFMGAAVMAYLKNDDQFLYLGLDLQADPILDPGNSVILVFDKERDLKWDATLATSDEGMITMTPDGATFSKLCGEYPNRLGADLPKTAAGITFKASTEQNHVQIEIAIDLQSSPLQITPGQPFGLALFVDDPGYFTPFHLGYEFEMPKAAIWENPETFIGAVLSTTTAVTTTPDPPAAFTLAQNYPNPFNNTTVIRYTLPAPAEGNLRIYNLAGETVRTLFQGPLAATAGSVTWDGTDDAGQICPSGVYFYQIRTAAYSVQRKLLLLK